MNLSISNGNEEITGKIQFELFQQISASLEMEYEKFFIETKKAITTNKGLEGFNYILTEDKFRWTKNGNENIKIIYGTANLIKGRTIENMLKNSADIIADLKSQLTDKNNEEMKTMQQLNDLKKLLQQVTDYKEINEKDVYTKFICLLNAKKGKIDELKSTISTSNEDNLIKIVTQSSIQISSDSSADLSMIQNLPKRRKFQPLKVIKPAEKDTVEDCQKSSEDYFGEP